MTTTKKLLVLLALAAGACQADNRSSIAILGRAAPSSDTECTYAAGGEFQMGPGILDVGPAFSTRLRYSLPVYVNNELGNPATSSSASLTSSKTWRSEVAKVRVNPRSFVKDLHPSPPLLQRADGSGTFEMENVIPLDGQAIEVGADSVQFVEAVSHELGLQLQANGPTALGDVRRIVLGISLQGHTLDGAFLETAEWYYPVNLCFNCLVGPASCPADAPVLQFGCGGAGQDQAPVCVAP